MTEQNGVERSSATDGRGVESGYPHTLRPELHKALDAAGIDYWVAQGLTFWNCPDGRECVAYGHQANGKPVLAVKIVGITDPQQAIEATMGRGTCHDTGESRVFHCSECGFGLEDVYVENEHAYPPEGFPRFCPWCGRKVVK